jgi:hypothetical protein
MSRVDMTKSQLVSWLFHWAAQHYGPAQIFRQDLAVYPVRKLRQAHWGLACGYGQSKRFYIGEAIIRKKKAAKQAESIQKKNDASQSRQLALFS